MESVKTATPIASLLGSETRISGFIRLSGWGPIGPDYSSKLTDSSLSLQCSILQQKHTSSGLPENLYSHRYNGSRNILAFITHSLDDEVGRELVVDYVVPNQRLDGPIQAMYKHELLDVTSL